MDNQSYASCYYCPEHGEYWDFSDKEIISVCKQHLKMETTS